MVAGPNQKQKRLAAFVAQTKSENLFVFADAAGVFEHIQPIVRDAPDPGPCRVARASLPQLWRWIARDQSPLADAVVSEFIAFALGLSAAPPVDAVRTLHLNAGRRLLSSDAFAGGERDRTDNAAADPMSSDAHVVGLAFANADAVSTFLSAWTADLASVSDPHERALRAFLHELKAASPDAVALGAALAMERLHAPEALLPVLAKIGARRHADQLDQGEFGQAIAAWIEDLARGGAAFGDSQSFSADFDALKTRADRFRSLGAAAEKFLSRDGQDRLAWARTADRTRFVERLTLAQSDVLSAIAGDADAHDAFHGAVEFIERSGQLADDLACAFDRTNVVKAALASADTQAQGEIVEALASASTDRSGLEARADAVERVLAAFDSATVARRFRRRVNAALGRPDLQSLVFKPLDPMMSWSADVEHAGVIDAEAADRLWDWLCESPVSTRINEVEAQLKRARGGAAAVRAEVSALRVEIADLICDENAFDPHATPGVDVAFVGDAFACAPVLAPVLAEFPGRIPDVSDHFVSEFKTAARDFLDVRPNAGPTLVFFVLPRLSRPWHALRLVTGLTRHSSDTAIVETEYRVVGDALLDMAEAYEAVFWDPIDVTFNGERVVQALERFAPLIAGMQEDFTIRKDSRWGKRLFALRAKSSGRLEEICREAQIAITAVTPWGARGPDLAASRSHDQHVKAEQLAYFLARTRVLDSKAAFAAARVKAAQEVSHRIQTCLDGLFEMSSGAEDDVRQDVAERLQRLAPIVRAFDGDQAADLLERRIAAVAA